MIVSIHQPNYIPWIGFFHKMSCSDVFVLLDNVKHSKSSITHRNRIKTSNGEFLLSIPLKNKESLINELLIHEPKETLRKQWRIIESSYKKSPHWNFLSKELSEIYFTPLEKLVDLNIEIIQLIKSKIQLKTKIIVASDMEEIEGIGSARNLNICKMLGATRYLSGVGAKSYNDEESCNKANIKLVYTEFKHPIYRQLWGDFLPNLSIIDYLFNVGAGAISYFKSPQS